jgi:hypothetical protein
MMIVWIIIFGLLCVVLMLPARIFGACCGMVVRVLVRDRKPPTRPPI